jgi:membrane protein
MRRMPVPPRTVGLIGRAVAKFLVDEGSVYSGHVAFSTLLALFPFLIFVTAWAAFVGAAQKADHYVALLATVLPEEVARSISPTVKQILSTRRGSVLTVSLIGTVWVASSGIEALRMALNRAYGVQRKRHFVLRRLQGFGLMIVAAAVVLLATTAIVLGPLIWKTVIQALDVPRTWKFLYAGARHALTLTAVFSSIAFLYRWLPNVPQRWRHVLPGAALASAAWIGLASLFSVYLNNIGQYNVVYGGLGGIVISLVFFFFSGAIFILGAEVNGILRQDEVDRMPRDQAAAARNGKIV